MVDVILGNDIKRLESNTPKLSAAITRLRAKQLEQSADQNTKTRMARAKNIYEPTLETVPEIEEPGVIKTETQVSETEKGNLKASLL